MLKKYLWYIKIYKFGEDVIILAKSENDCEFRIVEQNIRGHNKKKHITKVMFVGGQNVKINIKIAGGQHLKTQELRQLRGGRKVKEMNHIIKNNETLLYNEPNKREISKETKEIVFNAIKMANIGKRKCAVNNLTLYLLFD